MRSKQVNRSAIHGTNPRTRPFYHRTCKRANSNIIDSLPDDLLSEILLRVPLESIHEKARFVCKRWRRIIHGDAFVYAHLHRTSHGLLVSLGVRWYRPDFMTAADGRIEISELSYEFAYSIGRSCNGLILREYGTMRETSLVIVNPATKRRFNLPQFCNTEMLSHFSIGYAAASIKYKVVGTRLESCDILTVGVDNAWRRVSTQQLSPEANRLLDRDPLIIEGFMHWASSSGNDVLTMNVETEVFAETPAPLAPPEYRVEGFKYNFLSTGRHLSVLFPCGDYSWEVWEMKGESGEWRKLLPNADLKAHKSEIQQLISEDDVSLTPVGWVKYPVVLLFRIDVYGVSSYIVYNLDKDEIDSIELPYPTDTWSGIVLDLVVHKNSLVWLG